MMNQVQHLVSFSAPRADLGIDLAAPGAIVTSRHLTTGGRGAPSGGFFYSGAFRFWLLADVGIWSADVLPMSHAGNQNGSHRP
jgi:hypothetical protein